MAKYNSKNEPVIQKTETLQGGQGYTQTPEMELIGLLATGTGNTFYEKESEREKKFKEIFAKVASKNPTFAAKALVYARTVFGQRSVTHFGSVELAPYLSGKDLGKRFFSKRSRKENSGGIIYRIDDMAEILAAYKMKNGENAPVPNSIKKGFKDAIENSDAYVLAKYQMKNRGISLVDIVNLVHPKETPINGSVFVTKEDYEKAIKGTKFANMPFVINSKGEVEVSTLRALVLGLLKQFDTVEDKNTETGKQIAEKVKSGEISSSEAQIQLNEEKASNYKELIETKKIGYLALLRNIRNILNTSDSALLDKACELLVNSDFIKKSKVYPHQIDLALEVMLTEFTGKQLGKISGALNEAYEKSIPNLAELFSEGKTAVVLDVSGSMSTYIRMDKSRNGSASALEKGSLIAATLAKGISADTYVFANNCARVRINPLDSVHTLSRSLGNNHPYVGGGTVWQSIFPALESEGGYDRIFVISDEQDSGNVEATYKKYAEKYGSPYVYIINMCGYGPTALKAGSKIFRLFGYSSEIYELAKKSELDPKAVIAEINKINI